MQRCTRCGRTFPDDFFEPPLSICLPCYMAVPANAGLDEEQLREKARNSRAARRHSGQFYSQQATKIKNFGQLFRALEKSTRSKATLREIEASEDSKFSPFVPGCDTCDSKDDVRRIDGQFNKHGKPLLLCRNCAEKGVI